MASTIIKPYLAKQLGISILIYLLPIALMITAFAISGYHPWENFSSTSIRKPVDTNTFYGMVSLVFQNLRSWGLSVFVLLLGVLEFFLGMYDEERWNKNERTLDIVCYILPKIIIGPIVAFFSLQLLPQIIPNLANIFGWVPFWWGFLIIAVADDLTQYWYHRLHHQLPFLWRFHRTHHSASYMGMAMASRQNIIYTIFFSQTYLTAFLTFLGLGIPALFVRVIKSVITTLAHSSLAWDKPLYRIKWLHPVAWVLERLISTPATHHAHHADSNDGVGHFKGNFGNMFFIWDLIFGTGIITRKFPSGYGIKSYKNEEWYAQIFWPILKSKVQGSSLSAPHIVKDKESETMVRKLPEYQTITTTIN